MMFNAEAAGYTRRRLVPCFDAFYGSAIRALELAEPGPVRVVLDLGDGHGRPCGDGRRRTPGGAADAARWRAGHGGEGGGDSRATRCRGARSGLLPSARASRSCQRHRRASRAGVAPGTPLLVRRAEWCRPWPSTISTMRARPLCTHVSATCCALAVCSSTRRRTRKRSGYLRWAGPRAYRCRWRSAVHLRRCCARRSSPGRPR